MSIVVVRKIGRHWEARCTYCPNYRDARFGQVRFWTWQQMLDWANRHASAHPAALNRRRWHH